jgi:hypothetical protein
MGDSRRLGPANEARPAKDPSARQAVLTRLGLLCYLPHSLWAIQVDGMSLSNCAPDVAAMSGRK